MKILGIESSADETAAAIVESGSKLLSNAIHSQVDLHAFYGGIVPEISARSHIEVILPVVEQAFEQAESDWSQIDAIAVTYAPGLVGSLLIGSVTARTLALIKNKPLYPIHHVKAHVYANFINPNKPFTALSASRTVLDADWHLPKFPILALIVSGGHTQLVLFKSHQAYEIIGKTQDDAVGEAFDKVAKILGLAYPGGPSIAAAAEAGDAHKYDFPKAKLKCTHSGAHAGMERKAQQSNGLSRIEKYGEGGAGVVTPRAAQQVCHYYDFSFSGLKTAVLRRVQAETGVDFTFPSNQLASRLKGSQQQDFAASFQRIAVETLVDKTVQAYRDFSPASVVIAGGVAASQELRHQLSQALPIKISYPPMSLCTDNAAMIASCAYYESRFKQPINPRELEVVPSLVM